MKKIMFVCLGNICRSPMAEYIFKDIVKKRGKEKDFYITSAGTSAEEQGHFMYPDTVEMLKVHNIPYGDHSAKQLKPEDYEKYDYIIGMESTNVYNILRICGGDPQNKVHRILDFTDEPRNIRDPWYYGNFELTYEDIREGCLALYNHIIKNKE